MSMPTMVDQSQWGPANTPAINPPEVKRTVGRPPRNRRREPGKQKKGKRSVPVKCSKCGEMGHNKNGCMGGLTVNKRKLLVLSAIIREEGKWAYPLKERVQQCQARRRRRKANKLRTKT
ncbi:Copia protein [Bienertia sinuspersici]